MGPHPGASRPPRTVVTAVRLMYTPGAALELATFITIVVTAGSVRSAVLSSHAAAWPLALSHLTADEIAAPIVAVLWVWLAWANSQGYDGDRLVFTALFALTTLSLIGALANHATAYACVPQVRMSS